MTLSTWAGRRASQSASRRKPSVTPCATAGRRRRRREAEEEAEVEEKPCARNVLLDGLGGYGGLVALRSAYGS